MHSSGSSYFSFGVFQGFSMQSEINQAALRPA